VRFQRRKDSTLIEASLDGPAETLIPGEATKVLKFIESWCRRGDGRPSCASIRYFPLGPWIRASAIIDEEVLINGITVHLNTSTYIST
jgi:hypothetical protein